MVKKVVISDQPGSPGSVNSHVPYVAMESQMKSKNMTPVAVTNQLVNIINHKVRTGSGVRGRSATASSEHVLTVAVDYYRATETKKRIWWITSLLPAYLIVVSLLRLNLVSTIYVFCFMISASTHPLLTGVDPNAAESRSCRAAYISGGTAAFSVIFQVAMQAAYHMWIQDRDKDFLKSVCINMFFLSK